jgi:cyclophilin family peptidyl-prolyl cis-trans isomerase
MSSKLSSYKAIVVISIAGLILAGCNRTLVSDPEDDVKGIADTKAEATPNNNSQNNDMYQKQSSQKTYESAPSMTIDENKVYVATMKTNKGDVKIELDAKRTPKTVNNFVFLSKEGFYNGVIFHRVIADFMAQGGDPTGTGMGDPGYKFEDEISSENFNNRGTISMANAGPNTNGSQFFINVVDNNFLDGKHTAFGKVIEGMDIVDQIVSVETDYSDKPLEDIVINEISIEEK